MQVRRIPSDEISIVQGNHGHLGEGAYGVVKLGFMPCYDEVAVKCCYLLKGSEKIKKKFRKEVGQELEILHLANHKNIVQVYACSDLPNGIAIIMEYLSSGNLRDILSNKSVDLTSVLRLRMVTEVASALAFAHKLPDGSCMVHGELSAENILLTEDLHCKVGDFCNRRLLSCMKNSNSENQTEPGKFKKLYFAPELLRDPGAELKPTMDVYSFAILIYEVSTRERAVSNYNLIDIYLDQLKNEEESAHPNLDSIIRNIKHGTDQDQIVYDILLTVMKQCWFYDVKKRATMQEIKKKLNSNLNSFNNAHLVADVLAALQEVDQLFPIAKAVTCSPLSSVESNVDQRSPSSSFLSSINISPFTSFTFKFSFRKRNRSSMSDNSVSSPLSRYTKKSFHSYNGRSSLKANSKQNSGKCLAYNEWRNTVLLYDVTKHRVVSKSKLTSKHYGGSVVKLNDMCYVISGFNSHTVETSLVTESEMEWSLMKPTIETRWQAAATTCNDMVYISGGYGGINKQAKKSAEMYNPDTDQWLSIKPMNWGRFGHAMVAMRGLVYAIGGEETNTAEYYDPREGEWNKIDSMKMKRGGVTAVLLYDQIYAIGGYTSKEDLSSVEAYNQFAAKWMTKEPMHSHRRYHGSCVVDGRIIIGGGARGATLQESVELYNPDNDAWFTCNNEPEFKGGLSMTSF